MSNEINIKELKETYEIFKYEFNLPEFDKLNKQFSIIQPLLFNLKKPFKDDLLSHILNLIYSKISGIANSYANILYNSTPSIITQEINQCIKDDLKEINREYLDLTIILNEIWTASLGNNEDIAKLIKESYKFMIKAKKQVIKINTKKINHLKSIDLNKYFNKNKKSNYYG